MSEKIRYVIAGVAAGAVNGLLGAGGGMILVPLLTWLCKAEDDQVFPSSVAIILPVCLVSLSISPGLKSLPWNQAWIYLVTGIVGSVIANNIERKIPVKWLHRGLGILIIYGGVRYLC